MKYIYIIYIIPLIIILGCMPRPMGGLSGAACDSLVDDPSLKQKHLVLTTKSYGNMDVGIYLDKKVKVYESKVNKFLKGFEHQGAKFSSKPKMKKCQDGLPDMSKTKTELRKKRMGIFFKSTSLSYKKSLDKRVKTKEVKGCEELASELSNIYVKKLGKVSKDEVFPVLQTVYQECLQAHK